MAKAGARGLVGAFEREAIRPHIGARFEDLLRAAVTHPGMLRYLDNHLSAGPNCARRAAGAPQRRRRGTRPAHPGLNENLARGSPAHTLGSTGYTQADVTAFARADRLARAVDPAWRQTLLFDPACTNRAASYWHVVPRANALDEVFRDLARHARRRASWRPSWRVTCRRCRRLWSNAWRRRIGAAMASWAAVSRTGARTRSVERATDEAEDTRDSSFHRAPTRAERPRGIRATGGARHGGDGPAPAGGAVASGLARRGRRWLGRSRLEARRVGDRVAERVGRSVERAPSPHAASGRA
jgi:hypothetical protein